jgi:hypothetical protein
MWVSPMLNASLLTEEHGRGQPDHASDEGSRAVRGLFFFNRDRHARGGVRVFILMNPSSVPLIHVKALGQLLGYGPRSGMARIGCGRDHEV